MSDYIVSHDGSSISDSATGRVLTGSEMLLVAEKIAQRGFGAVMVEAKNSPTKTLDVPDDILAGYCLAEWDASASIRSEFGTVERYVSYRKASAAGRVKIVGNQG